MRTIYYGEEIWLLHPDGAIERPRRVPPNAETWRVVGAVRMNNFDRLVERRSLDEILAGKISERDWQYKNGKQKWHIMDLDHGTLRMWCSPKHSVS